MKNFTFYEFLKLVMEYSFFTRYIDVVNQIIKGNHKSRDYTSREITSLKEEGGHKFTKKQRIFREYCGEEAPNSDKKVQYMKGLKLNRDLESGSNLVDKLNTEQYYIPQDIQKKLYIEKDIYVALVVLLEAVIHNECIMSSQKRLTTSSVEYVENLDYHRELRRAIEKQKENESYSLNIFKMPLEWYINQIINHTKTNNVKTVERGSMSLQSFIKKTTPNSEQSYDLYLSDIEKICTELNVSIGSILYCYENKEYFESNPQEIQNFCHTLPDYSTSSKTEIQNESNDNLIVDSKDPIFRKWLNKSFYCYFSSTNPKESKDEKKKKAGVDLLSNEYSDLFEIFSDDHIYSGILTFKAKENPSDSSVSQCIATVKFMVDPKKNYVKEYSGPVIISDSGDKHALFVQLYYNDEITFMILNIPQDPPECLIASILTLSSRNETSPRLPCVERMIMSEKKLLPDSLTYNYMRSHLRMHDSFIRIDTKGYDFLIQDLNKLDSNDAKVVLEKYGDLHSLKKLGTKGQPVIINELAYINDWMIDKSDLTPEQCILFETMLRCHSIAPWYSKVNHSQLKKLENIIKKDCM